MRRSSILAAAVAIVLAALSAAPSFAANGGEDTDTRKVNAKVVEVTDDHISVIARSGVEHVIAINDSATKVSMKGKAVSLKDLRLGDVVTVELDEQNPLKFAKRINIAGQADSELATAVP